MKTQSTPNIIICMCDQMRAFEVGCYGHPVVRTPHIDGLAADGCRFEIACSNSPLCIPARNVLLSGQYARTCVGTTSNFCGFPPCEQRLVCLDPTLPETLRAAGYRTALVGKWHLHPAPRVMGFDQADYPHNLHQHHRQSFYDINGQRTEPEGFSLDYEMQLVERFLSGQRQDSPFFLYYNISPPHSPLMDAPARYTTMYRREQATLRDNVRVNGKIAHDPRWFRNYMWDYLGHLALQGSATEVFMPDDYAARRLLAPSIGITRLVRDIQALMHDMDAGPALRRQFPFLDDQTLENFDLQDLTTLYYGMVTCVDDYVGKLLKALDHAGLAENTIVLFLSDHGDNLGSHHLWQKDRLYEESIRIPMIFRWPAALPPQVIRSQVASMVDLMPTLLRLAGMPIAPTCQGTDLSPVLRRERDTVGENCAYLEAYRHQAIGIRTLDHLYGMPMRGSSEPQWTPDPDPSHHLAFDMVADPYQVDNRAASDGALTEPFASMRQRLHAWHDTTLRRPVPDARITAPSVAIY